MAGTDNGAAAGTDSGAAADSSARESLWLRFGPGTAVGTLSLFLVFYTLADKPLAADEATSYFIAHLDWSGFWESVTTSEANASLFYFSLHFWIGLGNSEFILRALPALLAAGTIPLLYLLGRQLFGVMEGTIASLLLAVNTFFVAHGQEVRGYSMSAFLVTASTLLFVKAIDDQSRRLLWIGYAIVTSLSLYAHFFASLVVGAQILSLVVLGRQRIPFKRMALSIIAIGLLISPLAYFILSRDVGQVDWIRSLNGDRFLKGLDDFAGMGGSSLVLINAALLLAVTALAVAALLRFKTSRDAWRYLLVILWVVVPLAGAVAISLYKPLFISRYLLVIVPGIALASAVGLRFIRQRLLYLAAGLALVALTASNLPSWYETHPKLDWEQRAQYVAENAEIGDATLYYSPTVIRPFGYYAGYYERDGTARAPDPVYPPLYWLGYSATRFRPDYDEILTESSHHDRVWLVKGYARGRPRQAELGILTQRLDQACTLVGAWFGGSVRLYEKCDSG
jgi:4-amino-4-deoxy-L-arabinose transferase-like glycosyltransferase